MKLPKILLASQSPRRRQLLVDAGFEVEFVTIDVEEDFDEFLKSFEIPMYLSLKKANGYEGEINEHILVTADTIVWINDKVMNKPINEQEAVAMLKELSGNVHQVYTAVCLKTKNNIHQFYNCTEVFFKKLTSEEIDFYVTKYQPYDKAGAYGVQEWLGYIAVDKINGCFYNVMGFPISMFYTEINKFLKIL